MIFSFIPLPPALSWNGQRPKRHVDYKVKIRDGKWKPEFRNEVRF